MTDTEIVKGVKLCNGDLDNCKECPFDSIGKTCGIELAKAEIGLIERLQAENAALRERLDKAVEHPFYVFDKKTGKEADVYEIALNEDWAKHLMYCDMDGFAIDQDGTLILIDECGQLAYCPSGRFEICNEARLKELKGEEE